MTIRSELEKRLILWSNAQVPPITVALENVSFTKPPSDTGKYFEIFFLPTATINPNVSATREREYGILQINICVPQNNGSRMGDELAASVKALFPVLPKTGTVSIERPPNISQGIPREDGFWVVPISISYRQER